MKLPVFCFCLLLLFSCHQYQQSSDKTALKTIKLTAFFGEQPLDCSMSFEHEAEIWSINSLGFYFSDLEIFVETSNDWHPVSLEQNQWQNENTGLVWFSSDCENANKPSNTVITFQFPDEFSAPDVTHLRFLIGIPFTRNHLNPLVQPSPLNIPEMFWSWQNGYKFMRLDMQSSSQNVWSYHLGSTGCISASSMRSPERPCKSPNVVYFSMPLDLSGDSSLMLQLDTLFNQIELSSGTQCMFNLDELPACQMLMKNMLSNTLFTSTISSAGVR